VDQAIRTDPLPDYSLVARKLGEDHCVIVAAAAPARRFNSSAHPRQLARLPWVTHSQIPSASELYGPGGERSDLAVTPRAVAS